MPGRFEFNIFFIFRRYTEHDAEDGGKTHEENVESVSSFDDRIVNRLHEHAIE